MKTRFTFLVLALIFSVSTAFSQTARVQVIHNSADAEAEFVDVYLDDGLLIDDFEFRTASEFIDAPAGTPISIDVAPGTSSSSTESIYNLTTTLTAGETYVLVASGIVSASGYSPAPAFGIDVFATGREAATTGTNTDLLVYHGSTDAPIVDVYEATGPAELVGDLAYTDFSADYLELPTADYYLQVRDETGSTNLFAYDAPLATLSLDGAAAVVVASGFVDPSANSDGAAFGLFVALPSGGALVELPESEARVQVIHNSADAIAEFVDVYLNDELLIDDFEFRTASSFIDAPANTEISIDIAPGNSSSSAESIYNLSTTLTADETYVLVASGIVSGAGYSPAPAFGIDVFATGREAATTGTNTDLLVYHGSTDAPIVDVYEATGPAELVGDLAYTDFSADYLELPTADYYLQVRDETGSTNLFAYDAPLATLDLDGAAAVVVASGFVDPSVNSDGAAFGLFVALPSGGALVELPESKARVQVVHNSADDAADTVDVYLNDEILLDDFAFRNASPFVDAPANTEISIDIAPKNSSSSAESIYNLSTTLMPDSTYVLVASGIVNPVGYSPAPAFGIDVFDMGREAATVGTNTDLLVYHGSTDAPIVDVYEATGPAELVGDLAYTNFADDYLELATNDYFLQVRDETGSDNLFAFDAPLATLGLDGAAAVVVASGFIDTTANSNGPEFGLFVALPTGGEMVALPRSTARVQVIHNSADLAADTVDIWLDDELLLDNFAFRNASPYIDAYANVEFDISVQPKTSTDTVDALAQYTYTLAPNGTYVLVANGMVSSSGYDPLKAFNIDVFGMGQEEAAQAGNTDVLVYHGSTDAPTVDVVEPNAQLKLVDDLSYSEFTSAYIELATADYSLQVQNTAGTSIVAQFGAPLSTLELDGEALVVVASGFLTPTDNSNGEAFGLFVALPAGGELVELPAEDISTAKVQVIHNSADDAAQTVDIYLNEEMLLDDFSFRTASPFVDVEAGVDFNIQVQPGSSTDATDPLAEFTYNLAAGENYILIANGMVSTDGYDPLKSFNIDVYEGAQLMAETAGNTDVLVYHGSTDAPTVDVAETSVPAGTLVDNLSYSEFTSDYLNLATTDYILAVQDETGATTVAEFEAPLSTLGLKDSALVVLASGFLTPSNNSDGAAFGLFAALPAGGSLVELPAVTTNVEELLDEETFNVYPNPVRGNLTIEVELPVRNAQIGIYNILGAQVDLVSPGFIEEGSQVITYNTDKLPAGVYFVTVTYGENRFAKKFKVMR